MNDIMRNHPTEKSLEGRVHFYPVGDESYPDKLTVPEVHTGADQPIVIEKMYGPTIFADIRITASMEREGWIVERRWISTGEWIEWSWIPAQIDQEFTISAENTPKRTL